MSENLVVLVSSLALLLVYWPTYSLLRPKVDGLNDYGWLFLVNMVLAMLTFVIFGIYIDQRMEITTPLYWANLAAIVMGIGLHHVSIIDQKHFSSATHGRFSHLLFFIPSTIFLFLGLYYMLQQNLTGPEQVVWSTILVISTLTGFGGIMVGLGFLKLPW